MAFDRIPGLPFPCNDPLARPSKTDAAHAAARPTRRVGRLPIVRLRGRVFFWFLLDGGGRHTQASIERGGNQHPQGCNRMSMEKH
jgi:hypothetical protein